MTYYFTHRWGENLDSDVSQRYLPESQYNEFKFGSMINNSQSLYISAPRTPKITPPGIPKRKPI